MPIDTILGAGNPEAVKYSLGVEPLRVRIEDYSLDQPGRERRKCYFPCPRKPGQECHVLLKPWPIRNCPTWDWDGNRDAPTLSPSINCNGEGGCGWHGFIQAGQIVGA